MKNIFFVALVIVLLSCVPTMPEIRGYDYIGTVLDTSKAANITEVLLSNDRTFTTTYEVSIGDYVYRNKYGQLKVVNPDK